MSRFEWSVCWTDGWDGTDGMEWMEECILNGYGCVRFRFRWTWGWRIDTAVDSWNPFHLKGKGTSLLI